MKKKRAPAALGPAQKNAVLTLETHFTFKNAFYKKKKTPAALGPAQKNAVLTLKTHFTSKNAFYERQKQKK